MNTSPEINEHEELRRRYALTLGALVGVQLVVGYEWLVSALTKIARGGFPGGLAEDLTDRSKDMYGWYWSFLDWLVVPNAKLFGYLIELGELAIAAVFIGAGITWLLAGRRLSARALTVTLAATIAAGIAGISLNLGLHLANGTSHPFLLGSDPFEEGVDLDMFMVLLQLVLLGGSVALLRSVRAAGKVLAPPAARPARAEPSTGVASKIS